MRRKDHGYATITGPGRTKEFDVLFCYHCNAGRCVATNSPDTVPDPGGLCKMCMQWICTPCLGKLSAEGCVPFEKKLDWYERRYPDFVKQGWTL